MNPHVDLWSTDFSFSGLRVDSPSVDLKEEAVVECAQGSFLLLVGESQGVGPTKYFYSRAPHTMQNQIADKDGRPSLPSAAVPLMPNHMPSWDITLTPDQQPLTVLFRVSWS